MSYDNIENASSKRVLHLNATANWGSTGKIAENLGKAAIKRGWNSYIGFGRYRNPGQCEQIKVGSQLDIYSHYGLSKLLDREGFGSKNATKALIEKISKDIQPDIIHLHNIHDHWLNFPLLFKYLYSNDIPVVWTFHDCWSFTGGCFHFRDINCDGWRTQCKNCQRPNMFFNRSHANLNFKIDLIKGIKNKIRIISVSNWLDSLISESRLKELNHKVIHNGIDISVFKPSPVNEINEKYNLKDKYVLLGVSNVWHKSKGLNDYIELRKQLDSKYIIILVGLPKKLIPRLPEGFIGIQRTTNVNDLVALYSRADAVLSLSIAETFGLTLVEGMACGTPSIGYAATATNEIITETTGIKTTIGDIKGLVEAANFIVSNKPFLPEQCRQRAVSNFNQDIQFNKYIDLYEEILNK